MTRREQEILAGIREDPLISQQELARRAGITRSSVAVHISNLMRKGLILSLIHIYALGLAQLHAGQRLLELSEHGIGTDGHLAALVIHAQQIAQPSGQCQRNSRERSGVQRGRGHVALELSLIHI